MHPCGAAAERAQRAPRRGCMVYSNTTRVVGSYLVRVALHRNGLLSATGVHAAVERGTGSSPRTVAGAAAGRSAGARGPTRDPSAPRGEGPRGRRSDMRQLGLARAHGPSTTNFTVRRCDRCTLAVPHVRGAVCLVITSASRTPYGHAFVSADTSRCP